mmetsp:Transcript_59125/g.158183  ORF Transcript_59125/g.158183 Transcript_59125/m.158183 type:complete len:454 (+) Transcript_59125:859-2220(+)
MRQLRIPHQPPRHRHQLWVPLLLRRRSPLPDRRHHRPVAGHHRHVPLRLLLPLHPPVGDPHGRVPPDPGLAVLQPRPGPPRGAADVGAGGARPGGPAGAGPVRDVGEVRAGRPGALAGSDSDGVGGPGWQGRRGPVSNLARPRRAPGPLRSRLAPLRMGQRRHRCLHGLLQRRLPLGAVRLQVVHPRQDVHGGEHAGVHGHHSGGAAGELHGLDHLVVGELEELGSSHVMGNLKCFPHSIQENLLLPRHRRHIPHSKRQLLVRALLTGRLPRRARGGQQRVEEDLGEEPDPLHGLHARGVALGNSEKTTIEKKQILAELDLVSAPQPAELENKPVEIFIPHGGSALGVPSLGTIFMPILESRIHRCIHLELRHQSLLQPNVQINIPLHRQPAVLIPGEDLPEPLYGELHELVLLQEGPLFQVRILLQGGVIAGGHDCSGGGAVFAPGEFKTAT